MSGTSSNQQGYSDAERVGPWQERLQQHCAANGLRPPIYSIASDRRGGRTAWSCSVDVQGTTYNARYWYDGNWVSNAKEDCAQVAIERIEAVQQQQTQTQSQTTQANQQNQTQTHGWPGYGSR